MLRHVLVALALCACGGGSQKRAEYYSAPAQRSVLADMDGDAVDAGADDQAAEEIVVRASGISAGAPHFRSPPLAPPSAGGGGAAATPNYAQTTQPTDTGSPTQKEALVVEGWLRITVDDVTRAAVDIKTQVEAAGGRVVDEQIQGIDSGATYGTVKIRLPPEGVEPFLSWLEEQGKLESKRIQATDVSKILFEWKIQLTNLEMTLDRLRQLLQKEGLTMADVLAIEKEMTRIRGEIESIKGRQRWLLDRVAYATLEVTLTRTRDIVFAPHAKIHPGPRVSGLLLTDPQGRESFRVGYGATLHFDRAFTMDLDVFPDPDQEGTAVLASLGGAIYSDFLGNGKREWLNPYLGLRLGYGRLSERSHFLAAAQIGLEIFKSEVFLLELDARAVGLFGDDTFDMAVQASLGFEVPF